MTVNTTVITASMPERAELLHEAMASVRAQGTQPAAHLIRIQEPPDGTSAPVHLAQQHNRLLNAVDTKWTSTLDDDDTYQPHHFAAIRAALETDADVIYTFAEQPHVSRINVTDWPNDWIVKRLEEKHDCIPANATIRTITLRAAGGWDETTYTNGRYPATGADWEDWDLWLRLARQGCRFVCVPIITWDYRSGDWQQASH